MIPVNYWAVFAAAVLSMVVGFLWYSPVLFAKPWMKLIGKTEEELKQGANMGMAYGLTFLGALVAAYVMAHFVYFAFRASDVLGPMPDYMVGASTGFWAWLGFVVPPTFSNTLFEGKRKKLWLIDVGHYLVLFVLMGVLLAVWR